MDGGIAELLRSQIQQYPSAKANGNGNIRKTVRGDFGQVPSSDNNDERYPQMGLGKSAVHLIKSLGENSYCNPDAGIPVDPDLNNRFNLLGIPENQRCLASAIVASGKQLTDQYGNPNDIKKLDKRTIRGPDSDTAPSVGYTELNRTEKAKKHIDRSRQLYNTGVSFIKKGINLLRQAQGIEAGVDRRRQEQQGEAFLSRGNHMIFNIADEKFPQIHEPSKKSALSELYRAYCLVRQYEMNPLPPLTADGIANPQRINEDAAYVLIMGTGRMTPNRLGLGSAVRRAWLSQGIYDPNYYTGGLYEDDDGGGDGGDGDDDGDKLYDQVEENNPRGGQLWEIYTQWRKINPLPADHKLPPVSDILCFNCTRESVYPDSARALLDIHKNVPGPKPRITVDSPQRPRGDGRGRGRGGGGVDDDDVFGGLEPLVDIDVDMEDRGGDGGGGDRLVDFDLAEFDDILEDEKRGPPDDLEEFLWQGVEVTGFIPLNRDPNILKLPYAIEGLNNIPRESTLPPPVLTNNVCTQPGQTNNSDELQNEYNVIYYPSGKTVLDNIATPPYEQIDPSPQYGVPDPQTGTWDGRYSAHLLVSEKNRLETELYNFINNKYRTQVSQNLYADETFEKQLKWAGQPLWKNGPTASHVPSRSLGLLQKYQYDEVNDQYVNVNNPLQSMSPREYMQRSMSEQNKQISYTQNDLLGKENLTRAGVYYRYGIPQASYPQRGRPNIINVHRDRGWGTYNRMLQHALFQLQAPSTDWLRQILIIEPQRGDFPLIIESADGGLNRGGLNRSGEGLYQRTSSNTYASSSSVGWANPLMINPFDRDDEYDEKYNDYPLNLGYPRRRDGIISRGRRSEEKKLVESNQPLGPFTLDENFGRPNHIPGPNYNPEQSNESTVHRNVWLIRTNQPEIYRHNTWGLDFY